MTGTRTHRPPDVKRRQYQVLDSSANKTQAESGLKECPQGTGYKVTCCNLQICKGDREQRQRDKQTLVLGSTCRGKWSKHSWDAIITTDAMCDVSFIILTVLFPIHARKLIFVESMCYGILNVTHFFCRKYTLKW